MMDQEAVIEGLLCPICMKDLGTITKLQEHFETAHSSEDGDVLQQLKEFFGKAKKKILKVDQNEESGEESNVKLAQSHFSLIEEEQEIGSTSSHLEFLRKQRHSRINCYALETNKLLNRLYRLITDVPSEPDRRKDHEREVVPWVLDKDVKLCPNCATSFNLSKRRHHCRLCGGIMCQNCSQFLDINVAKKLTQNMFHPNSSIRSPSPVKPSTLTRRGSSNSLMALVSPPADPHIRLCQFCKNVLDKQDSQLELRTNKPILVQMYDRMKMLVEEIEKVLPIYINTVQSLMAGETIHSLGEAQEMRFRLTKLAENVDSISRKIGILGSQDDPPPAPVVLKLQGCIRMSTSTFLRENLLGIPPLPDEKTLQEVRQNRDREIQRRIESKKVASIENASQNRPDIGKPNSSSISVAPSRPKHLESVGLVKESGWRPQVKGEVSDGEEPMIQQMNIIRNYIQQAREANKMDEVRMLQSNLKELEEEYARQNLSGRTQF